MLTINIKEENRLQHKRMIQNLQALRWQKGWSIDQLSQASGIGQKILTQIEAGQDFNLQYLIELCRVYHIKPHEIFDSVILPEQKE